MLENSCCTFLRGELYISDSSSVCDSTNGLVCGFEQPLKKMGNIEGATISISSQILGTENKFHYMNNNPCSRVAIQSVDISLTISCTKKDNMKLGLLAKEFVSDSLEGYVQEVLICNGNTMGADNFFMFKKSGVDLESVVASVFDADSELLYNLIEGEDYAVSPHGITLLDDVIVPDAQYFRITYDYNEAGTEEFDFLSEFNGHKFLYFKGTNYADDDNLESPFGVEIYRVLFNPISQFDLISQGNYFVINLVGRVERDYTKTEEGLGGYFKIKRG